MARSLTNDQLHELRQGNASFGSAVAALKEGYKVARSGWYENKRPAYLPPRQFLFYVDGSKFQVNRPPLNKIYEEGTEVEYRPHIDLKAADGTVGVWNPNMMDILAEDWQTIEEDQKKEI